MSDAFDDKNFGSESEMKAMTLDWGKIGDHIIGTFVSARHGVDTQFGKNSIYKILAERGQFHALEGKGRNAKPVENPTKINGGDLWDVWGRGDIFNGQMNSLRPGQVVKLEYADDQETSMGVAKIVKVYAPKNTDGTPRMNEKWLEEQNTVGGDL